MKRFLMVFCAMFFMTSAFADTGVNFTAKGRLWTDSTLRAINKAERSLKNARRALKRQQGLSRDWFKVIGDLTNEIGKLGGMIEHERDVREHVFSNLLDDIKKKVKQLKKDQLVGDKDLLDNIDDLIENLKALEKRISQLEQKDWGFGLTAGTDLNYADGTYLNISTLGFVAYWTKGIKHLTLSVGCGINSQSEKFSWNVMGTAEVSILSKLSIGAAVVGVWDMGNFKGAAQSVYGGGGIVRYSLTKNLSIFGTLLGGVYGEKEKPPLPNEPTNDPMFTWNLGSRVGINYYIF